jgi:hypothetical protein
MWALARANERERQLSSLPTGAQRLLEDANSLIVDVGPGEGGSSIALARRFPNVTVLGVEMDRKHLVTAWPARSSFPNLELVWGALRGTPSNPRVDREAPPAPEVRLPAKSCDALFSYLGMSYRDIFSLDSVWPTTVRRGSVLVIPQFWLDGLESLPGGVQQSIREIAVRRGSEPPDWGRSADLPGFGRSEVYRSWSTGRADGWLLWLSGLFDDADVYLWDTLRPGFDVVGSIDLCVVIGYA